MKTYPEASAIGALIDKATKVLIVQADNPDADSLGSALALEGIIQNLGKKTAMYCAVEIPGYLRYLPGWDRVTNQLPNDFDLSIIVDASTLTLLDKLISAGQKGWLAAKPCIVLDHHKSVDNVIDFATVTVNDAERASTGELIYILSQQNGWQLDQDTVEMLASSILGDTQGLSNSLATAETLRIMADLLDQGLDRQRLEEARRELSKMPPEIYNYKAKLIERTELHFDDRVALVSVPQDEINKYSPLYNPAPLIQGDMLQIKLVQLAAVFKIYQDGKVTAALRCTPNAPIAAKIAEQLGGGGHDLASGFKTEPGKSFSEVKAHFLEISKALLDTL